MAAVVFKFNGVHFAKKYKMPKDLKPRKAQTKKVSVTKRSKDIPATQGMLIELKSELGNKIASTELRLLSRFKKIDAQFSDTNGKIASFDERFAQIDGSFAQMEARFYQIDGRFAQMEARFSQIDERFAQMETRFAQIDQRFAQIDERFAHMETRFAQIDQRFAQIDERFAQMDQRFCRIEERLDRLEGAVLEIKSDIKKLLEVVHNIALRVEEQNARNIFVLDGHTNLHDRLARVESEVFKG